MDKVTESGESEGSNPVMVNISVDKLVELLQKIALNKSKRSPLTRARSDPTNWAASSACKRKSIPEIFIFPDVEENDTSGSSQNVSSHSLSFDGQRDSDKSVKAEYDTGSSLESKSHSEYTRRAAIMPLSLSYEERQSSCHGVSEVYFKNVVNELVKTKNNLKDLQMQNRLLKQDKSENDKLKQEVHRLRFTAQHLQREHRHLTDQNNKLRLKLSAYKPPGMNDSFELRTAEDMQFCDREVQTDLELSIRHDGPMTNIFQQKMEDLIKENDELVQHYNGLKNSVKILNSCLNEEKVKNRNKEKELVAKGEELKKVFSQLTCRRQEYDELLQDHIALKKNMHLYDDDHSYSRRSRHSSRSSGSQTPVSSHTSGRNLSGDQLLYNIQPAAHSSLRRGGTGMGNVSYQNDLSTSGEDEHAPSNIPFSRQSSYRSAQLVHSSGERESQLIGHGINDTQPRPQLECPTCWMIFHDDGSFLYHMTKCLS